MTNHPEEALPAHSANIGAADGSPDIHPTLTVGALRQSLRDLPADASVMVTVGTDEAPRAALYAHQGANGRMLLIAAGAGGLPRQER